MERRAGSANRWLASDVDSTAITDFLEAFRHAPEQKLFADLEQKHAMLDWIDKFGSGPLWNVVLLGNSRPAGPDGRSLGEFAVPGITGVPFSRAPLAPGEGLPPDPARLNFKAIMSQSDKIADLDPVLSAQAKSEADRRRIRRQHAQGRGVLLLYPISRYSKRQGDGMRADMPELTGHLLGFALVFPHVYDPQEEEGTYVSVRRDQDFGGEYEEMDE